MSDKEVPEDIPTDETTATSDPAEAEIAATVEAILFATDKPLAPAKVSEIGELGGARAVRKAVDVLNARYEQTGASFRIVEIAGGYQMQSLPEYADVLARLTGSRTDSRLTQAALEALAIIAYRQPILRADVEAIRGVACGEVIRGLMEKNLVRIAGRAEVIGRPLLYGTTRHFLELFGLGGLEDLPKAEKLLMPAEAVKAPAGAGSEAPEGEAHSPPAEDAAADASEASQPGPSEAAGSGGAAADEAKPAQEQPAAPADDEPSEENADEDELDDDEFDEEDEDEFDEDEDDDDFDEDEDENEFD